MSHGNAMISLRGLRKQYSGREVLAGIDLDVQAGQCVTLIGPSGSGKSTLIRCVNGLVKPDGGSITIAGNPLDLHDESAWQRLRVQVGMVFQDYTLFPHLSVLDNITLAPVRRGLRNRKDARDEARQLLDRVGLADKAESYPAQLSGGQQQRVAIVRSLAMHPKAILFDEPTSALDPESVGGVLAIMRELADKGMTMIVVTHEMQFARDVSDHAVFMADCQIVEQGPPAQLFRDPQHARTRAFLSGMNA